MEKTKSSFDVSNAALASIFISLVITLYCQSQWLQLGPAANRCWWISCIVLNVIYLYYGYFVKKNLVRKFPNAWDVVIALTGPILFYFITTHYVLQKWYFIPREEHEKRIAKLQELIKTKDLSKGFDFDFDLQRDAADFLKEMVTNDLMWGVVCNYTQNKRKWTCASVCDTLENLKKREAMR